VKANIEKVLLGDQLAGAKLIRMLEEGDPMGIEGLKALYAHTGNAFVLGITGAPGCGKSTLITHIITELRQRNMKIGVVAIDPSSPLSGGAFLGDRFRMGRHTDDRFRMGRHTEDEGVFIRSMATRGHLGGLSKTTYETVMVLDAMGYDAIIIETVGVGQAEVEIAELAHTKAVVSIPGMGDDIQAMKAGILEIGDVFVVNKADRPGADEVVTQLRGMLEMGTIPEDAWHPPVLDSGDFGKHNFEQTFQLLRRLVMEMAADKIFSSTGESTTYQTLLDALNNRKIDPFTAAETLVKGLDTNI
jgi:LAO/AO transport system kinase